jgi:hypothetical protein
MDSTISIKKVIHNNREHPAIKFNPDEEIRMSFVQEAVFALIVAAINPLSEEHKKTLIRSIRENMLNLFDKSEGEVFDFFINQCKMTGSN